MHIYEGAVRSAKTVTSLIDWYNYVIRSPENVFLMSGATMGSLARNCLDGDYGFIAITGGKAVKKTDTDQSKFLLLGNKKIYYVGSDNAASYKKIRGLTIGGSYSDEMNLHNKAFFETMLTRSFASKDRRIIGTLNPDTPNHWLYKEYLDVYAQENIPGYHWFHFTLDDNTSLSEEQKNTIKSQFPRDSVFYRRYILGQRVRAEGICYPSFRHNKPGEDGNILDVIPKILFAEIGSDIGGNKSATTNALTGYFIDTRGKLCAVLLDESYDTENKSTESILNNWRQFVVKSKKAYQVNDAYPDSAEQLIVKSMRNMGIVNVYGSRKFPILDRIRFLDGAFSNRRVFIMRSCEHTIEAVEAAVWNQKSEKEERLDDGTCNIDSLDAWEYSWERRMTELSD